MKIIRITTEEESRAVQEEAFSKGYKWWFSELLAGEHYTIQVLPTYIRMISVSHSMELCGFADEAISAQEYLNEGEVEFREGDKVRVVGGDLDGRIGWFVEEDEESMIAPYLIEVDDGWASGKFMNPAYHSGCLNSHEWVKKIELVERATDGDGGARDSNENIINNKPNNKTMIKELKNLFTSEPEKTYIEAGVYNEDGTPSSEGRHLYLQFKMKEDKEFFEMVKKANKEAKKRK